MSGTVRLTRALIPLPFVIQSQHFCYTFVSSAINMVDGILAVAIRTDEDTCFGRVPREDDVAWLEEPSLHDDSDELCSWKWALKVAD